MKEIKIISFNWNERVLIPEKGWSGSLADGSQNRRYKNFYIGFGLVGFYWMSMFYDGLPMWSLGIGLFRISYADCHRWEPRDNANINP